MVTVSHNLLARPYFLFQDVHHCTSGKHQVYSTRNFHLEVSTSRSWLSHQPKYLNDKLLLQTDMNETEDQTPRTRLVRLARVPGAGGQTVLPCGSEEQALL